VANWYKTYIDYASIDWTLAWYDFDNAQIDLNSAWVFWGMSSDHAALQRTLWAVQHILDGVCSMVSHNVPPSFYPVLMSGLKSAWEYETETPPEVTWKSIVEAWVKNDFEGRVWTIGVIDRMRQILWNEPFNITWAARPEQQEIEE